MRHTFKLYDIEYVDVKDTKDMRIYTFYMDKYASEHLNTQDSINIYSALKRFSLIHPEDITVSLTMKDTSYMNGTAASPMIQSIVFHSERSVLYDITAPNPFTISDKAYENQEDVTVLADEHELTVYVLIKKSSAVYKSMIKSGEFVSADVAVDYSIMYKKLNWNIKPFETSSSYFDVVYPDERYNSVNLSDLLYRQNCLYNRELDSAYLKLDYFDQAWLKRSKLMNRLFGKNTNPIPLPMDSIRKDSYPNGENCRKQHNHGCDFYMITRDNPLDVIINTDYSTNGIDYNEYNLLETKDGALSVNLMEMASCLYDNENSFIAADFYVSDSIAIETKFTLNRHRELVMDYRLIRLLDRDINSFDTNEQRALFYNKKESLLFVSHSFIIECTAKKEDWESDYDAGTDETDSKSDTSSNN